LLKKYPHGNTVVARHCLFEGLHSAGRVGIGTVLIAANSDRKTLYFARTDSCTLGVFSLNRSTAKPELAYPKEMRSSRR
jgi:hypothetical protein